jgi:uncharacterized coiled-coil protein SlyX
MTAEKVTKNSTKDVIFSALQEALAKVKALEAEKLDPKKEVEVKKATATIEKAEAVASAGVNEIISTITNEVTKALANVATNIEDGIAQFNDVKAAIELKKAELKELFGVEDELLNLAAIVNGQSETTARFNADYTAKKIAADAQLKELQDKMKAEEADFRLRIKNEEADIKAKRAKDADEYKYDTDRAHKIESDKWNDQMATSKKEFEKQLEVRQAELDTYETEIDVREEAVAKREDKMNELEAKVAEIPTLIATAAEKAAKDAEANAKKSYGFETMMLKKDNEGQVALKDATIATLQANATKDAATIADLQLKLNAAYAEMKDMATKSIEGASNSRAYTALEGVIKDMNAKQGSK